MEELVVDGGRAVDVSDGRLRRGGRSGSVEIVRELAVELAVVVPSLLLFCC